MIAVPGFMLEAVYGCVPARTVDNLSVTAALVGDEKARGIVAATGFPVRRVAAPGQTVRDLMVPAARAALDGVDRRTIGGIVSVSFSAPARFPGLAAQLQETLDLPPDVAALDLGLACSGYPYGLMVAGQLAAAMQRRVLLVDGDVQSAFVAPDDVTTRTVMSDAATATLVAPGGAGARFAFRTEGAQGAALSCPAAGPIAMNGFGVFRFVAAEVTAFLKDVLAQLDAPPDCFVPHQANMYMVRQLARALGLEAVLRASGAKYANPGSCSVPLTLADGSWPSSGVTALLAGFGAGLAAAAAVLPLGGALRRGVVVA